MSSNSYKFNFRDLSRFMDDFTYLFKKGGRHKIFQKGGDDLSLTATLLSVIEFIIYFIYLLIRLTVIVIIIYILYVIIFRGYPRIVVNLLTLSFYSKVNIDALLRENDVLSKQFIFLKTPSNSSLSWYSLYNNIYDDYTQLYNLSQNYENLKTLYYSQYKYNDMYIKSIGEYFLFYNKINTNVEHLSDSDVISIGKYVNLPRELDILTDPNNIHVYSGISYIPISLNEPINPPFVLLNIPNWLGTVVRNNNNITITIFDNLNLPPIINIPQTNKNANTSQQNTSNDYIKMEFTNYKDDVFKMPNTIVYELQNNKIIINTYASDKITPIKANIVTSGVMKIPKNQMEFYDLLLTYKIINGEITTNDPIKGGKKSDDQLLNELYASEANTNFVSLNKIISINDVLQKFAIEINRMQLYFTSIPLVSFIIVPDNDINFNAVIKEYSLYKNQIDDGSIFNIPYLKISDLTWIFIEFMYGLNNPNQYSIFSNNIPYHNVQIEKIIYYLNYSREEKKKAEEKIMNYKDNSEFYEYIKRRPIFAHIYFTNNINTNLISKGDFYKQIINTYSILSDCKIKTTDQTLLITHLTNLQYNGYLFKQLVNTVFYFHLLFNMYQNNLTALYQQQVISDKRFLRELIRPYANDIFNNRIKVFARRTFNKHLIKKSKQNFFYWYYILGDKLRYVVDATWKAFFTSVHVDIPETPETDDGQDPNSI